MSTLEFRSFVDVLRTRATQQPSRLAYGFFPNGEGELERLTYAELDLRVRSIAARLQALGCAGERALLLFPPGLDYTAAFLGCLYAGVVAVPAYPPRNARALPRIKGILADARARIVLARAQDVAAIQTMASELPELRDLNWVASDGLDPALAAQWQPPEIGRATTAFLQYTSGSTGEPKGVVLSHGNLLDNSAAISRAFGATSESVGMSWLPPYHDMGLIGGVLQPLYAGFPVYLMAPTLFLQRPLRWLSAIAQVRATISGGPDFAYELCARKIAAHESAELDLSCWKVAFNGAEPVRAATLDGFTQAFSGSGFQRRAFLPCYGLAEATLFVTGNASPTEISIDPAALEQNLGTVSNTLDAIKLVSSGSLDDAPGTTLVVAEARHVCAEGEVGEIWVRNTCVAQGYWNKPELSAEVFGAYLADGRGPFLRTGDLGFARGGQLYVTGRIKDLIILRGRNLYPNDIESAAQASDPALRVGFGTAFSVEAEGEERLILLQELDFRQKPDLDAVQKAILHAVTEATDIVPHAVVLLKAGALPTTSSGKLRRREARQMFLENRLTPLHQWQLGAAPTAAASAMPMRGMQSLLAARIASRMGIPPEQIDIDLPFTNFGLDSVEAVSLSGDLEQTLGRRLPPTLLWDYPSIRKLAAHLDGEDAAAPSPSPSGGLRLAEPVAIIGAACRFPGAPDLDAYWQLLCDGVDAITTVPPDRWDGDALYDPQPNTPGKLSTQWGGFIPDIDAFDASLFGISPKEARTMDPQQRLLLETAWAAFEHAGLAPAARAEHACGVFIGISTSDYARRLAGQLEAIDASVGTGNANSIAANRISYQFGLQGPSMAVDTACSSSLVAVHLACQSLLLGESDLALAGGVNLLLEPDLSIAFSHAGMMAPDGRCKTFDIGADGYVRGEGCGVVVLKRLADAQRDGDAVLAVVRGSAVNQSGRSNGLTAPSGAAQRAVIRRALERAGVAPAQLSYVEAHGTGTALGDPIEIQALADAVGGELRAHPCAVGSVKTNLGHLEAAAGIAGLIKVVLMLQHQTLPPHLHMQKPNPRLKRNAQTLTVPCERQPWAAPESGVRFAGISSFGFGGSNAHVIVQEAAPLATHAVLPERPAHLLTLSAKGGGALRELALRYRNFLAELPCAHLADVCFTAHTGRARLADRLCVIGASPQDMVAQLDAFLERGSDAGLHSVGNPGAPAPSVAIVLADVPDAAAATRQLREIEPWLDADQRNREPAQADLALTETRASVGAYQQVLMTFWQRCGIQPAAVVGKGGEAADRAPTEDPVLFLEIGRSATPSAHAAHVGFIGSAPQGGHDDTWPILLRQLAHLWLAGADIDWQGFECGRLRRRIPLPSYPFQRERHWAEAARRPALGRSA